jgi:arylsulfatase A-like enzyme
MSSHYIGVRQDNFSYFIPELEGSIYELYRNLRRTRNNEIDAQFIERMTNSYDNGILQSDDYIRRIFDVLRDKKLLDNSIVVITSDHGEALSQGGLFGHGNKVHFAEINIPLLFFSETIDFPNKNIEFSTLIDIGPSILGIMNVPPLKSWTGINVFEQERMYSKHLSWRSHNNAAIILREKNEYYMFSYFSKSGQKQLFNLTIDPYKDIYQDYLDSHTLTELKYLFNSYFKN